MTRGFVLTPLAEADLIAIWDYIAEDESEAIANRRLAMIYDACERLVAMPGMGHHRENLLSTDYRFWSAGSYVIAYRWQTTPLQVIAVVHGARELTAFFGRRR